MDGAQPRTPSLLRLQAFDKGHSQVSNFCLTYHIQFGVQGSSLFRKNVQKLQARNVITVVRQQVPIQEARGAGFAPYQTQVATLKSLLARYNTDGSLPFTVLFHLQALVYNGYFHPDIVYGLAEQLCHEYVRCSQTGERPISAAAIKKLFDWVNYRGTETVREELEVDSIMGLVRQAEEEVRHTPSTRNDLPGEAVVDLTPVFRAVVTPSRITLHGPEMEAKNRVLRKFPGYQESFLRVQFCDDNGRDLHFNAKISLDEIYDRFKSVLERGIQIAGRIFSFLGFSHSSLRAHSAWFSAPFVYNDTLYSNLNIVEGLGDFKSIRSPARKAARIGQAFSETPFAVPLDENEICVGKIDDIAMNSRIFSDGVGTVSPGALEVIWRYLPQAKRDPTCLQIRLGGAKGMLASDNRLPGKTIALRPSMTKFESLDVQNLEICDMASRPIKMVLNRQIIKILEDMGVPNGWFLGLQARELDAIRNVTQSTANTSYFLRTQNVADGLYLWRLFSHIDSLGIEYRKDKFLRSVVEAAILRELRLLKHKARITVPEGITLFGIMDETGFLEEGQVFVTFDTMLGRYESPPGNRKVIVTRSPALHPGDIQIAKNIVPPVGHMLRDLSNCIVFSQRGKRDLPSQLSGGVNTAQG